MTFGMFTPANAASWAAPKPAAFLTATERSELLNWCCFDALPVVLPPALLDDPRYFNSPEFQPDDLEEMYIRMRRLLEDIPVGRAIPIRPQDRTEMHVMLNQSWFSEAMTTKITAWGTGQSKCFMRARYLFVTHWFSHYPRSEQPEDMLYFINKATDIGLNKRFALQAVHFDGFKELEVADVRESK